MTSNAFFAVRKRKVPLPETIDIHLLIENGTLSSQEIENYLINSMANMVIPVTL